MIRLPPRSRLLLMAVACLAAGCSSQADNPGSTDAATTADAEDSAPFPGHAGASKTTTSFCTSERTTS